MTTKACPRCPTHAEGRDEVEAAFGFRRNAGKMVPQSWCRRCRSGTLPVGAEPFRTVLADPAWTYNQATARGGVASEYATMSTRQIAELPVEAVASRNSVLLLWSANPMLKDALRVMDAWGFEYKTKITWCKNTFGTGFWVRSKTEDLLIGTRGKPPLPEVAPPSVLHAVNRGHSQKPPEIYPVAERLGAGPRLELFARERRHGWASWGNQLSETAQAALEVLDG